MAANYPLTITNDQGTIRIHTSIFVALADEIINGYDGLIRLENHRNDFANWVVKNVGSVKMDACDIDENEHGMAITLYVVIHIKANAEQIAYEIVSKLRESIRLTTGIIPYSVCVHITGIQTDTDVLTANISYRG